MFLDTLRLNNFRSFKDEQICFGKDLTILVHKKRYHWYPLLSLSC
jgi:predicted ATP-binding protein involved in virulence